MHSLSRGYTSSICFKLTKTICRYGQWNADPVATSPLHIAEEDGRKTCKNNANGEIILYSIYHVHSWKLIACLKQGWLVLHVTKVLEKTRQLRATKPKCNSTDLTRHGYRSSTLINR